MIRATVLLAADGCLVRVSMRGHASNSAGPRGGNVICAAVTALVRSCAEAVSEHSGITVDGAAEAEGEFVLSVRTVDTNERAWLRGVSDVLASGLRRMAGDSPDEVAFYEERAPEDALNEQKG